MTSTRLIAVAVTVAAALASLAAASVAGSSTGSHSYGNAETPYKIFLSNTLLNNGWRLEMQSILKAFAASAPYNRKVEFKIINGQDTVAGQIASIRAILPQRPDAILIDPNSPTALNPVLNQAIDQGAKVVAFDSAIDNPKVYTITTVGGLRKPAYSTALWLIRSMGGKGNLVINNGVLGTGGQKEQNAGVMDAVKKFPKVKVVAQFEGKWATAPSAEAFQRILATHPQIDGVWDSGGESGVIQVLQKANKPLIPVAGYTFNQYFQQCHRLKAKGLECAAASYPSTLGAEAMKVAIGLIEGKKYRHTIYVPYQVYVNNGVKSDVPVLPMPKGNPKLPLEFTWPFNPVGGKLTAQQIVAGMK